MKTANSVSLWLDCDTGHDDAFAILLAAQHPSINILGISTTCMTNEQSPILTSRTPIHLYWLTKYNSDGNAPLSKTTYNTLAILKAIGREDVPVFPGASKPFCRVAAAAPDIHGESGLDGTTCLPTPTVLPQTTNAITSMYSALIAQPPGTAYLVATGACTNIALLFSIYPDLASHIAGLSIMGGAIGNNFTAAPMGTVSGSGLRFGNWTPYAEFNIYLDPESASAIFSNPILSSKTTLIPLDLTHQFLATSDVQNAMLHGYAQSPSAANVKDIPLVRKLFREILMFFAKTYDEVFGMRNGPPTHDPLAVAAVFLPELFDDHGGERYAIQVVTEGDHGSSEHARGGSSECGRTVATLLPRGSAGVRIPRSLEVDRLWRLLENCLARAENVTGNGKW